jgi:predicted AAA+ superfamily ATPase
MVRLAARHVPRRLEPVVSRLLGVDPVIALHGPRSVGKSTLLHEVARAHDAEVLDLDDPGIREAVAANPTAAVSGPAPVCIDEYQHAPEILSAIKARLNRDGSLPGTALLTGSTRQDALPRTAETLTGRVHHLTIWPLSQGEIGGTSEDFLPSLRNDAEACVAAWPRSDTTRLEYAERVCAGGFPLALRRTPGDRDRWFRDYVTQSVERDVRELARIRDRQLLRDVLNRLAGRTGSVLDISKAMAGLPGDRSTHENYIRLLEDLFLVRRLPAWGTTLTSRAAKSAKVHMVDSGLASHLLGLTPAKVTPANPSASTEFGHVLESFVYGELSKQASWLDEPVTIGHWRTRDGLEVDVVIEFADGSVVAFEVKASERLSPSDSSGLRALRDHLGPRFIAGTVLTTGPRSYTLDDRVHVLPLDRLWRPVHG